LKLLEKLITKVSLATTDVYDNRAFWKVIDTCYLVIERAAVVGFTSVLICFLFAFFVLVFL
jgi:hypothetical protein